MIRKIAIATLKIIFYTECIAIGVIINMIVSSHLNEILSVTFGILMTLMVVWCFEEMMNMGRQNERNKV